MQMKKVYDEKFNDFKKGGEEWNFNEGFFFKWIK